MNQPFHKLRQETRQETAAAAQRGQQQAVVEFASVEEMIRQDAAATEVPGGVAGKIQHSISQEPSPAPRSWWRRLTGG